MRLDLNESIEKRYFKNLRENLDLSEEELDVRSYLADLFNVIKESSIFQEYGFADIPFNENNIQYFDNEEEEVTGVLELGDDRCWEELDSILTDFKKLGKDKDGYYTYIANNINGTDYNAVFKLKRFLTPGLGSILYGFTCKAYK